MPRSRGAPCLADFVLPGVAPEWVAIHRLTSASLSPPYRFQRLGMIFEPETYRMASMNFGSFIRRSISG